MTTNRYHIFVYLFVLLFLASCGIDTNSYLLYVEEPANGLNVSVKAGELGLMAQYKPLEYVLIKERHLVPTGSDDWDNAKRELEGLQYFSFHIERVDGASVTKAAQDLGTVDLVTYFSFDLERDFYLLDGKDSLPCVLFHWPRQFDLSPKETFLLAFPATDSKGDKTLQYSDKVLGIGTQRFKITQQSINSIPEIN